MDEKLYSSTASGYLILSRLKDSTYSFVIGFSGNQFPEQRFSCSISKKDHGYLVKNFGDKGWGLVDLQTLSVQMAAGDTKKDVSVTNAPVNAFTNLLAKAADDSSLKQKIVLPDEKKPETVTQMPDKKEQIKDTVAATPGSSKTETIAQSTIQNESSKKETGKSLDTTVKNIQPRKDQATTLADAKINKTDSSVKKEESTIPRVVAAEHVLQQSIFTKSKVVRKTGISSTEGFGITFIDTYTDGKQDTIKILIPEDNKTKVANDSSKDTAQKKIENSSASTAPIQSETAIKAISKNNCRQIASDADFYKLRKKMVSGKSDASMLDEANKVFRSKCLTSTQIKNLSSLFLGDGGKYSFFDAAYPHVSDTENFAALQSELKDDYFINRFKAMLR